MKASLTVTVSVVIALAARATADECHDVCADVKNSVSFKSGCSQFRNSLPRPKVARYCQEGFRAAVDANCYDACVAGGRLQSFLTERRLDEKCDRALNETPRPLCHDACVRGYRSGVKDMYFSLVKRMAKADSNAVASIREEHAAQVAADRADASAAIGSTPGNDAMEVKPVDSAISNLIGFVGANAAGEVVSDNEESERVDNMDLQQQHEEANIIEERFEESERFTDEINEINDKTEDNPDAITRFNVEEQEQDIVMGFEEDGLLLSLPITVDGVQKELVIFDGDEPMEVVLAFCADNMPDEGAACADQLLHVVQEKISA